MFVVRGWINGQRIILNKLVVRGVRACSEAIRSPPGPRSSILAASRGGCSNFTGGSGGRGGGIVTDDDDLMTTTHVAAEWV